MTPIAERQHWMGVLARALPAEIEAAWQIVLAEPPAYDVLRRPEIGMVMVQGRMGGDGGPFHLGEMTVTRCSVRLAGGAVGHAWVAGRDRAHAEKAAVFDALLQDPARRGALTAAVIAPLERARRQRQDLASRKAAATRVDFFTLARGED